jgi:tetratricopeptide (TPR) repeat protein
MYLGELDDAVRILERARAIAETPAFSDVSRADVLYRLGCCRVKGSEIAAAVSLYTVALELCDRSGLPCDRLRAHILEWRSRCYQRQRDFDAARADVERALELARGIGDRHTEAHVYFQASLIAERSREWLIARFYAEHAKEIYEDFDDQANVAKLLNNLGCLDFLLGDPESSIEHLKDSFRVALELGNEADAAQAVSSLAQVNLRTGRVEVAEEQARRALELLEGRADYLDEIGNAQLVLGRALLEQGKTVAAEELFLEAEATFEELSSVSHRAAAWMARAELALELDD